MHWHEGDCIDELFLACSFCDFKITSKGLPHDHQLTPSETARWYERMVKHLRSKHVGKEGRHAPA